MQINILFQTIQIGITTLVNCKKTFLFQAIQLSQTVLIQPIQFSVNKAFVYAHLNVLTALFQTIQLSVSTVSIYKTVLFQTIQFSINT